LFWLAPWSRGQSGAAATRSQNNIGFPEGIQYLFHGRVFSDLDAAELMYQSLTNLDIEVSSIMLYLQKVLLDLKEKEK